MIHAKPEPHPITNIEFAERADFCIRKQNDTDMRYEKPYHSEKKYIKNISESLSGERLGFMDGRRLGDIDIFIEDNATVRRCGGSWRSGSARNTGGHEVATGGTETASA